MPTLQKPELFKGSEESDKSKDEKESGGTPGFKIPG